MSKWLTWEGQRPILKSEVVTFWHHRGLFDTRTFDFVFKSGYATSWEIPNNKAEKVNDYLLKELEIK